MSYPIFRKSEIRVFSMMQIRNYIGALFQNMWYQDDDKDIKHHYSIQLNQEIAESDVTLIPDRLGLTDGFFNLMICHPNGVRSHTDKFSNTTGLTFFMNNAEGEFIYDGAYMHHNIARFDTVLFDDHIQHSFENQREKEKAVLPFFMLTNDNQRKESNRPYIIEGFSLHDIRVETDREYKLDRNGVPYMLQYDRIGRHKRVKLEA